jgi:hypothetical protein
MTHTPLARWSSSSWLPLAAAAILACCQSHPRAPEIASDSAAAAPLAPHEETASLGFLLSSAASDFRAHTPGRVEVRNVRFGLRDTTAGKPSYVLCGDFRRRSEGDSAQWMPFATVEGTTYEQWLGETRYCQPVSGGWNAADSLTTLLQRALE